MAVKHKANDRPRLIKSYWPAYRSRMIVLIMLCAILVAGIGGSLALMLTPLMPGSIELWIITATLLVTTVLMGVLVYFVASRPFRDIFAAVVHIAGEPSDMLPPNPNDKRYSGTSFGDAIQMIYKLASSDGGDVPSTKKSNALNVASALDNSQTGFAVLNHEHKVIYANKSAPLHTVNGALQLQLLFNGNDSLEAWLAECEERAVHAEQIWTRVPDRPADQEGQRIYDVLASYEKGAEYETVVTLVDRTAIYQSDEEDLNFIAFAAHELRGPITVIRGYLDVLQGELADVLQEDQRELFRRLVVSANRLSGYINNILNTSRYDRRHLSVSLSEDTIQNVYDTIRDDMELRASSQNRLLSVQFPDNLPTIAADRASLTEVFGNLIDNAIKYSNEGGVITVTAEPKGEFVDVHVEDHGIGMPGNVVSNLFQKFYRSHRSRETVAGTGIGLYISKAIAESHGGTISVRSVEGEGSTFTVSLPTYASVADKLQSGNNTNQALINQGNGWIKNHSMYRG